MTQTICAYAQFTKTALGVNSLTVTWDVERITRSDGTRSALVTGGANSVTIGRRGLYGYVLTGADLLTYDYVFTAITAGDVDQKEVPALWTSYSIARDAELARLDDTVTSRLAASGYIAPPSAATIADAVLDEAATGHTGLIPTNLDAKVSSIYTKVAGGRITVLAPVLPEGDVLTVQGADYYDVDGLALEWSITHPTDFDGATAKATIDGVVEIPVVIVEPTADPKVFRAEVSAAITAAIAAGPHAFRIVATFETPGANPEDDPTYRYVPALEGTWTSSQAYSPPAV